MITANIALRCIPSFSDLVKHRVDLFLFSLSWGHEQNVYNTVLNGELCYRDSRWCGHPDDCLIEIRLDKLGLRGKEAQPLSANAGSCSIISTPDRSVAQSPYRERRCSSLSSDSVTQNLLLIFDIFHVSSCTIEAEAFHNGCQSVLCESPQRRR